MQSSVTPQQTKASKLSLKSTFESYSTKTEYDEKLGLLYWSTLGCTGFQKRYFKMHKGQKSGIKELLKVLVGIYTISINGRE